MKKDQIKVGGLYLAKVAGAVHTVRVDEIRQVPNGGTGRFAKDMTVYDVTSITTKEKREYTFRSAAKFRSEAKQTITPDDATDLLSKGSGRDVNKVLVDSLTQDMIDGKWNQSGGPEPDGVENDEFEKGFVNYPLMSSDKPDLSNQRWCTCECGKRIMTESTTGMLITRCLECFEKYGEESSDEAIENVVAQHDQQEASEPYFLCTKCFTNHKSITECLNCTGF